MDKIQRRLPIQQRALKQPVVFAVNILLNHYLAMRTSHYNTLAHIFRKYNNVEKFFILANITNASMSIEERSA